MTEKDVHCHICGYPIYVLWVDKVHHGNKCMEGQTDPQLCSEARNRTADSLKFMEVRKRHGLPTPKGVTE